MNISKDTPLIDCMCGSGTILIEAFLKANNMPATIFKNQSAQKNKMTIPYFILTVSQGMTKRL